MKKNISFMALIAIVTAFALCSFNTKHNTETQKWFKFTGDDNTAAGSYSLAEGGSGDDPMCSSLPEVVCAIYATNDGGAPLQSELDNIVEDSHQFTDTDGGLVEYQLEE